MQNIGIHYGWMNIFGHLRDHIMPYKDENGILFIGVKDFLLHDNF